MGFSLKKLGKGISHVVSTNVRGLGRTVEKAAPLVGMIPGVGTLAGAAIGGLGSLAAGHNLAHTVGATAKGALGAGVGSALGTLGSGISKIPGIGGAISGIAGKIKDLPGASKLSGLSSIFGKGGKLSGVGSAVRAATGGKALTLGRVGDALKGGAGALAAHPELAAAGLSGISGFMDTRRAGQLEDMALKTGKDAYAALNPNAQLEDLTSIYANPGDPYAQMKRLRLTAGRTA